MTTEKQTRADQLLDRGAAKTYMEALLMAEIEELKSRLEWRPIDDAPKDGTEIFVYVPGETFYPTAASFKSREYFEKEYGNPEYMEEGWYWEFGYPSDFQEDTIQPTHWMPLPQPPK